MVRAILDSISIYRYRSNVSSLLFLPTSLDVLKETDVRLTDQSMIPFNGSFLLIYVLNVVMLAGNHALPMMLRFYIWLGTKLWRRGQVNETLHFLLDHPRRYVLALSYLLVTYPPSWLLICLVNTFTVDENDR